MVMQVKINKNNFVVIFFKIKLSFLKQVNGYYSDIHPESKLPSATHEIFISELERVVLEKGNLKKVTKKVPK